MKDRTLNVELRTEFGKNASNRLRGNGYIPAILYSHGNSEPLKVSAKDFSLVFKGHISESVLIDLNIMDKTEDTKHKAFVKDYHIDPVTDEILHIDFYKITAGEKIRTMVQVETQGTPKGVKTGGILEIFERELEIECLPKDLPERVLVDVSDLDIGDSIHIGDVKIGESVKLLSPGERVIATIVIPHVKEVEAEVEEVEGEEEELKEEKPEEEDSKAEE